MRGLTGKVAVVAGGATGIGAQTATRLGEEGCSVVVADINEAGAEDTASLVNDAGGTGLAVAFDISDDGSVRDLFAAAADAFGRVDLLFNVAADLSAKTIGRDTDVVSIDLTVWDRTMAVNLRGFVLTMREAIPRMLERGRGAIVNTSSAASFMGEPQRPAYAAAKAGINALTRHVANKWGREGIRCNAIAPGYIYSHPERGSTALGDMIEKNNPLGRVGLSDDIASMAVFLLSDDAAYVNGQVMSVDGGGTMR
jgi:NAD(P)-dependent dehydrogenase (short-subunit alcohol dehydrogenase family)